MDSGRLLAAAQVLKLILYRFTAGGWRSSGFSEPEDALVPYLDGLRTDGSGCAIYGLQSPLFTLSLVMACIVMYDATGVRRAAGEHAKVLNQILFSDGESMTPSQKALKEFLGHTPLEVLAGAILGVILGLIMPV